MCPSTFCAPELCENYFENCFGNYSGNFSQPFEKVLIEEAFWYCCQEFLMHLLSVAIVMMRPLIQNLANNLEANAPTDIITNWNEL